MHVHICLDLTVVKRDIHAVLSSERQALPLQNLLRTHRQSHFQRGQVDGYHLTE